MKLAKFIVLLCLTNLLLGACSSKPMEKKEEPSSSMNCTLSSRQYKKIKLGNGLSSIFYRAKAIKFG
ncbi:MAG: hypothetical protein LKH79_22865, partial [Heyndrickxia oleronia]|uniref:hypothetical protein n=1 Tax=Heyndrickxia oleronia TaxID=38875 RepID=UPI00242FB90F